MKPIKMKRPVTAIRQLDYEFAVYLALHPREKRRLRDRELRRKFIVGVVIAIALLVAVAKWSASR